jgi:pyrimidine operon attenuation protein/uracil phosphoribosyltransferase
VGKNIPTSGSEEVQVMLEEEDGKNGVEIFKG